MHGTADGGGVPVARANLIDINYDEFWEIKSLEEQDRWIKTLKKKHREFLAQKALATSLAKPLEFPRDAIARRKKLERHLAETREHAEAVFGTKYNLFLEVALWFHKQLIWWIETM